MKKTFLFLFILYFLNIPCGICEEVEIKADVVSVKSERGFFIIRAGKDKGIEKGDGIIVHRGEERIAEARIIEIRPNVSAAEILNIEEGKEIKEGDSILIVKEITKAAQVPPKTAKQTKSTWARLFGAHPKSQAKETVSGTKPATTVEEPKKQYKTAEQTKYKWVSLFGATPTGQAKETVSGTKPATIVEGPEVVTIDINRDPNIIYAYTMLVLRKEGFSIISSNKSVGILLATKPIALSLMKELWADAIAEIDHKLVVSLDIKGQGGLSKLTVSSFKEHFRKGNQIKTAVTKDSEYYNELVSLASKIKEIAEKGLNRPANK